MTSKIFSKLARAVATAGLAVGCLLAPMAQGGSPQYVTFVGANGTSSSTVIVPADPNLSIRLISLVGSSDKAGSLFTLTSGTNAYVITSNSIAGTLIILNQTNGLAASDPVVISAANGSTNSTTTISSFAANGTNVTLAAATFGTTNGDSVYKMSGTATIPIGVASNVTQNGEAIFTAPQGRPMKIVVDGTSWSKVDRCVVRYE